MCYCCFLRKYFRMVGVDEISIETSLNNTFKKEKNWPWFSTQQIYGLEILFSKLLNSSKHERIKYIENSK